MPRLWNIFAMGGSPPFLINEGCEGTGTPSGWTTVSGSPNWDYTTTVLSGSESLSLLTNGAGAMVRTDFTDQTEAWIYCMFRLTGTIPAATNQQILDVEPNGGGTQSSLSILSASSRLRFGSAASPVTVVAVSTTYHLWLHIKQGTGANGTYTVAFSTDGVRPTSGNNFAERTDQANTILNGRLRFGNTTTGSNWDCIFDKIRVAARQINDNGEF